MSSKKVLLYIVRHGESKGNVERTLIPPKEDNLTDKGKRQAIAVGDRLMYANFTRAYTSDYSRTFETAKLILQRHASPVAPSWEDIIQDKRLRERHLGAYEGLTYREALMDVIKSKVHINKHAIPKAETFDEINARADSFLKEVLNETFDSGVRNETILIVSHALFINRVMLYLDPNENQEQYGWRTVEGWEDKCQKIMTNASYMELEATRDEDEQDQNAKIHLKFLKIHERSHLLPEDQGGGSDLIRKFIEANPEGEYLSSCLQA